MAITIDYGNTNIINVELSDLTLVSGTLYTFDSDVFRLALKDIEGSEIGEAFTDTHRHVPSDTIAGTTDAKKIIILAPYSVQFPDMQISVRVVGSNNNIHDVEAGILVQNQAQIIPSNSTGLVDAGNDDSLGEEDAEKLDAAMRYSQETALYHQRY